MSHRMAQVNSNIQRIFGEILLREAHVPNDVLITISRVDTTRNLKSTTIWLYIMPTDRGEEIMKTLKPQMYDLQGSFNRIWESNPLPRVHLRLDHGAEHAERIERRFKDIEPINDATE